MLHTQRELVVLIVEAANTIAKFVPHSSFLDSSNGNTPKRLSYAETVLKKDPNLSTLDGLVHLAVEATIQIKSLDVAIENWDAALKIIMEVHNNFLDKYTISV